MSPDPKNPEPAGTDSSKLDRNPFSGAVNSIFNPSGLCPAGQGLLNSEEPTGRTHYLDLAPPKTKSVPKKGAKKPAAVPAVLSDPFSQAAWADRPPLTNEYLNRLIGWYREKTPGVPLKTSKTVWGKDEQGGWVRLDESWRDIDLCIITRSRNCETGAKDLRDHIYRQRVDLDRETLTQLLVWHTEKTRMPQASNHQMVWLKRQRADGKPGWDVASFTWDHIRREFTYPDVREKLSATSLDDFKDQLRQIRKCGLVTFDQYAGTLKPGRF